jgi:hypothetical protein
MNLCDFICEWCSEIEPVLVNGVVKLNSFLFLFLLDLGVGVEVGPDGAGAGSRCQLLLSLFYFLKTP